MLHFLSLSQGPSTTTTTATACLRKSARILLSIDQLKGGSGDGVWWWGFETSEVDGV